jgi:hypothetical protein
VGIAHKASYSKLLENVGSAHPTGIAVSSGFYSIHVPKFGGRSLKPKRPGFYSGLFAFSLQVPINLLWGGHLARPVPTSFTAIA